MPLRSGTGKAVVDHNTKVLIKEGRTPEQAYAIAKSEERKSIRKRVKSRRRSAKRTTNPRH